MKQNKPFRIAIVGVLWLCVGVGCQKDPLEPDCEVTGCCFQEQKVNLVTQFEGTEMDKVGSMYILLKTPVNENQSVLVCPSDLASYDTLPNSFTLTYSPYNILDAPYKYRLWGKLYENLNFSGGFNPKAKSYWVKIDRIEKAQ